MCHRANQTIAQWIMRIHANEEKMMQKKKWHTHTHQSSRTKLLVIQNWKTLQAFDYNSTELWIAFYFHCAHFSWAYALQLLLFCVTFTIDTSNYQARVIIMLAHLHTIPRHWIHSRLYWRIFLMKDFLIISKWQLTKIGVFAHQNSRPTKKWRKEEFSCLCLRSLHFFLPSLLILIKFDAQEFIFIFCYSLNNRLLALVKIRFLYLYRIRFFLSFFWLICRYFSRRSTSIFHVIFFFVRKNLSQSVVKFVFIENSSIDSSLFE